MSRNNSEIAVNSVHFFEELNRHYKFSARAKINDDGT